jgi:hypothetical protein
MKTAALITLIFLVIAGGTYGGYVSGHKQGVTSGKKIQAIIDKPASDAAWTLDTQLVSLQNQYNELADNYNTLRDSVIQYVGATQYKAAQPINCTSNSIGNYTYTNCY